MADAEFEIPQSDDPDRQVRIGSFLVQSRMLDTMQRAIFGSEQMHYCDAAEAAGIPFEVALLKVTEEGFWRDWFLESKDRPRRKKKLKTEVLPASMNLLDLKRDIVGMFWEAGLYAKAANMIRNADENTQEGGDRIVEMIKVTKDFYPKEATQRVIQKDLGPKDASTEELEAKLDGLLEQNLALQEKLRQGEAQRRALLNQGETDGGDREEPDATQED